MTTLFIRIDRLAYARAQWADLVCGDGISSLETHTYDSFTSRGPEYVESGSKELVGV